MAFSFFLFVNSVAKKDSVSKVDHTWELESQKKKGGGGIWEKGKKRKIHMIWFCYVLFIDDALVSL